MQRRSTLDLFSYWNDLRGTRSAPERRDIDPTRIRNALAYTFILQAQDDDFEFRLAGSHICAAYCRELKQRSFTGLWQQKDRDAVDTLIKAVTDDHAVALLKFTATAEYGNSVDFETMLLPLRHNGATNTRMIGSMTALEDPYWLGHRPILEQRITGLRLIWPDDHLSDLAGRDLETGVETGIGIRPEVVGEGFEGAMPDGHRRYAHLAVIDGGKR
jgi:hypothetical protein